MIQKHSKCKVLIFCLIFTMLIFTLSACSFGEIKVDLMNGETLHKTASVKAGEAFEFGTCDKVGYAFTGWYSEAEAGSAYTDAEGKGSSWAEDNATTLYAHFKAKTYTLKYDYNGATGQMDRESIDVVYDSEITQLLPVPERSGYSFKGWFTAKTGGEQLTNGKGEFIGDAKVFSDKKYVLNDDDTSTIYANWAEKTVTYNFVTDGTKATSVTYPINTVVTNLPNTIKDNYCFAGWYFDTKYTSPFKYPYIIPEHSESEVNLYAKFVEGSNNIIEFRPIASSKDREFEAVYNGSSSAVNLVVPDSYMGKTVTRIREIRSTTLKTVLLPETTKEILNNALAGCTSLEEVNIPNSITRIPDNMFDGNINLKSINIPESVEIIGKYAFRDCKKVEAISISKNIINIGDGAFANMTGLKSIAVDEASDKFVTDDGVLYKKLGNALQLIVYPASRNADTYTIQENTNKIMAHAFRGATISNIMLGSKITYVGEYAFADCAKLSNVVLAANSVRLELGDHAFSNCHRLKSVTINMDFVPDLGMNAFDGVNNTFSIYVFSDMIKRYQTAPNWRNYNDKIYSKGMIFGDFALEEYNGGYSIRQYLGSSKEVEIPEIINTKPIVKIGDDAFSYSDVTAVTVSERVTEIGARAFESCGDLTKIVMKGSIPPTLDATAFNGVNGEFGIYIDNTMDVLNQYKTANIWKNYSEVIWTYNK